MLRPLVLLVVLLGVVAPAASAQEPRIRAGLSAGGVDLSNLTVAEATAKLDAELGTRLDKPLVLGVAGRPWTMTPRQAQLRLDSARTAKRALYAGPAETQVAPAITFSRKATKAFVERIARKVRRAPRNSRVTVSPRRIRISASRPGLELLVKGTRRMVDAAWGDPAAPRTLHRALTKKRAAVTYQDLRRQWNTAITIDRSSFRLRLFKDLKVRKTYGVAVGAPGYTTPAGLFSIQSKQVNPTWTAPNSPWAGEMAGQSVAGGSAANPLKARWMGVNGSVGIHGTGMPWSIGTRASHGCIRMTVPAVIDLFKRVRVGTPVRIF